MSGTILIGITGASGAIYARRLIHHLVRLGKNIELVITENGKKVIAYEREEWILAQGLTVHAIDNMFAAPASGTSKISAMVVLPSSMGTIGKIAGGTSDNLLIRAADVCLKERKPLIVVPREMPFNLIHLHNMSQLVSAGAFVVSASPFFYYHPQTIEELIDTVVVKILDLLKIPHDIVAPWGSK